jgi:hypothetical protein
MPACGCRAPLNGMRDPTLLPWRPAVVHRRTPFVVSDLCTKQIANLHRGATRLYAVNAVCRVACLAWAWWMRGSGVITLARGTRPLLCETMSAKED